MRARRTLSKPRLIWLCFNGLVLLWLLARCALGLRLMFWYDKPVAFGIVFTGTLAAVLLGWGILGLRRLLRHSKALGIAVSVLCAATVTASMFFFFLPVMILGLGMAGSAKWRAGYYDSPEGRHTLVVIFGGDAGATTAGPYYAAYPMMCRGVYRRKSGNETKRVPMMFEDYIPPTVTWRSEREAKVLCGGEVITVEF